MTPALDNRFKDFSPQEQSVLETALKALATSGGGEQPVQGGELPPALVGAKPKDAKGVESMNTEKDIAGADPAVGAQSKFGPTDAHNDPGSEDAGVGAKPVGDKGTFTPTDDKDEEIKSLQTRIDSLKAQKAKKRESTKYDEAYAAYSAGKKAESVLREEVVRMDEELQRLKEEMGLSNAQAYGDTPPMMPSAGATPGVPTAGAATGLKDGGAPGGATSALAQGSVPQTSADPSMMGPTDPSAIADPKALQEEELAVKAMREAVNALVSKTFGTFPTGVVQFQKEFDDMLSQVAQPKGGSENMTNVASPGQPPAKIAAVPGESGSSQVFRTETGKAYDQDDIFNRARKNPAGTLETEANEPIATYDEATHVTTGGGYQPALLRSAPRSTFAGRRYEPSVHKSYAIRQGITTDSDVEDKLTAKRTLPVLKQLSATNVPSKEDIQRLEKEGKLVDSLVNKVTSEKKDTFLVKNLKRVYGE